MRTGHLNILKKILQAELECRGVTVDFNRGELAINYKNDLDDRLENRLKLLCELIEKLEGAHKRNDELDMKGALLRIRSHAMSASSLFGSIADDIEVLLRSGAWSEIPEDYRFPE